MKFYIKTYGCQMNRHDSEKMAGLLAAHEHTPAASLEDAELILLNTCSIREKAETKVYSQLGQLKPLKEKNPNLLLALCGCIAQQEGENLLKRIPYLDMVLGTTHLEELPRLVARIRKEKCRLVEVSMEARPGVSSADGAMRESRLQAWVSIMEGCNNYCAYCVVPYVRGPERSRSGDDIVREIKKLVADGVKEVTLLGQNVNSFGNGSGESFPQLLSKIQAIEGIERIRFATSHPKDLSPELIAAMAQLPKVMEHIHLPAQSGSSKVLARMNRKYSREEYLDKINKLRAAAPDIALTTDIIVGFPGETEEDHQETLSLLETVEFDNIFSFKFSPRPQTEASQMMDDVPLPVKNRRLEEVMELQKAINLKKNRALIGTVQEVLLEGPAPKKDRSLLTGRTRGHKVVHLAAPNNLIGEIVPVTIIQAHSFHLKAAYSV